MSTHLSAEYAAALDDLYTAPLESFLDRRKEHAARAKAAGDKTLQQQITALRKPTRSAYAINQLVRQDPAAAARLTELSDEVKRSERSTDQKLIRELNQRRRLLVEELATAAFAAIGDGNPSAGVREEVVTSLKAALADQDAADQVLGGLLLKPAEFDGFGFTARPELSVVGAAARPTAPAGASKKAASEPAAPVEETAAPSRTPAQRAADERQAMLAERHRLREEIAAAQDELDEADDTVEETDLNVAMLQERVGRLEELLQGSRTELADAESEAEQAAAARDRIEKRLDDLKQQAAELRSAGKVR